MAYKRKERPGFFIPHRCRTQLDFLDMEQRGQLLSALLEYSENGSTPKFDGVLAMAFATLAEQIDFDRATWDERCAKNAANRKKSVQTEVDNGRRSSTMVDEGDQPNHNPTQSQPNLYPLKSPKGDEHPGFAVFWEAYPNKRNKPAARKAFAKIAGKVELSVLLAALETQKRSPDWTKENGRYIPYPASWLNGRRWEDKPQAAVVDPCVALPESVPDYGWGV